MPFFRTSGGSILEIDLPDPRNVHAVERHDQAVERGDLVEVAPESVEWVEVDGAKKLVRKALVEGGPVTAPKRARKADPVVEELLPEEG